MANQGEENQPSGSNTGNEINQFKLVLLGGSAVGKSSLMEHFVNGMFQESRIRAAFLTQTVSLDDTTVKFKIYDSVDQDRSNSLAPEYYRGVQAVIVVYDITRSETFIRAQEWVNELQKKASPNIIIALSGNKADLEDRRDVTLSKAQAFAHEKRLLFMEISAKESRNVDEFFIAIAKRLLKSESQDSGAGSGHSPGAALTEMSEISTAPSDS